ncbi:MAG: hypothetical protein HON90_15115 [Halobacteriovoraceae bacterium]|jgi:hypothetical protein|nr:hypothetical protein [Halobacteriovoraceae bacterium]
MARIALVLFALLLASCSSTKEVKSVPMSATLKAKLYANQNLVESISSLKDKVFVGYENKYCLMNWGEAVYKYKDELRRTSKTKRRIKLWFDLANCYNYVGDFGKSLYYYDLIQGVGSTNQKMLSMISFNIGQILELNHQDVSAYSFYQDSLKKGDKSRLSLLKLAFLDYKQHEYEQSLKHLNKLRKYYPRSNLVNFLIGVNYIHLDSKSENINKVLKRIDEKYVGRNLLAMALDVTNKKFAKDLEVDLKNLDVEFKLHIDFKKYLLSRLGR